MGWQDTYKQWSTYKGLEPHIQSQLEDMRSNEKLMEDAFYKNLEFGTGGMRGELGPGTNRMNVYTIRKASEGLSKYILKHGDVAKNRGVVIAYDSRHFSPEFAMEAAKTLASHGIQTYVFDALRPTPVLSFAVRYLHAFSGIVITASHNPPQYNGFKVYNEHGGQLPPEEAAKLISFVEGVKNELEIVVKDEATLTSDGLISKIGETVDKAYQEQLLSIRIRPEIIKEMQDELNIVFSPLHGTALQPVMDGFKNWGFNRVTVVEEQATPDPEFSTVKSPNPEEHEAFTIAIEYGKEQNADILLATDPDADRMGVAVKNNHGEYQVLTGNQTGALLLHYLLSQKKASGELPDNGVVLKTIVTSEIGRAIADHFKLETVDTLTGFKFIGEKIQEYKETGDKTFLFGYEESYGYLIGDFVRDKDAVQACLLISEVAAFYKKEGKTLYEGLTGLFEAYGFYLEGLESMTLKGKTGTEQIQHIMSSFRSNPPNQAAGLTVVSCEDFDLSTRTEHGKAEAVQISLPKSNVLKYFLEDGSWFCLRPSGTEPKIKFYFSVKSDDPKSSETKLTALKHAVMEKVKVLLPV